MKRGFLFGVAPFALALLLLAPAAGAQGGGSENQADSGPDAPATPPAGDAPTALPPVPTLPDVEPGTAVPFDLAAGTISALPFDVPFRLVTEVGEGVMRLGGRYVGDTDPLLCEEAFPRARLEVDYGFGRRPLAPIERRQIHRLGSWETRAGKTGQQLATLDVPDGLLPNRSYCFEFSRVSQPSLSQEDLRRAMIERVDEALRPVDSLLRKESLRQDAYGELRRAVIEALESEMEPGDRLVVPAESFLNRSANELLLPSDSRRRFDAVLQAQMRRADAIAGFRANSSDAVLPALRGLLQSSGGGTPAAGDDLRALGAGARQDSPSEVLESVLRSKEEALVWAELAGLPAADRESVLGEVAAGEADLATAVAAAAARPLAAAPEPARPWDEVWQPDDLEIRRQNLRRTLGSLTTLKSLVAELRDQDLTAQAGAAGDLSALRSAVGEAIGETDFLLGDVDLVEETLEERQRRIGRLLEDLGREVVEAIRIAGSTLMSYDTGGSWYLGLDFGLAWAEDIEDLFTYIGTNIYLRPVNKRAQLRWSDFRRGQLRSELMKRLSVTIGLTLRELKTSDDRFEGISLEDEVGVIADRPVLLGAGLRLSRFVRLTGGALIFKDPDPDPLVDGSELAWSPLISVSIDWNFKASARKRLAPPSGAGN